MWRAGKRDNSPANLIRINLFSVMNEPHLTANPAMLSRMDEMNRLYGPDPWASIDFAFTREAVLITDPAEQTEAQLLYLNAKQPGMPPFVKIAIPGKSGPPSILVDLLLKNEGQIHKASGIDIRKCNVSASGPLVLPKRFVDEFRLGIKLAVGAVPLVDGLDAIRTIARTL